MILKIRFSASKLKYLGLTLSNLSLLLIIFGQNITLFIFICLMHKLCDKYAEFDLAGRNDDGNKDFFLSTKLKYFEFS